MFTATATRIQNLGPYHQKSESKKQWTRAKKTIRQGKGKGKGKGKNKGKGKGKGKITN